ncbi:hypothetical protein [Microbacterium rhizomatis]|uniref:Phage tail protein n=1 Tax=Microbacterium rhizomatis TaxID=1631477 RepID=A0A5J5IYJ4_9MICO|nr:hypothetical protein [Microbacterium rhizomatis]KAA9105007.1 hypothetical protein F6B43_18335 [Microbacterium rhizomatis]
MASIVPAPIILNDCVLVIGTDNYEASVAKVQLDPKTPDVKWKGMTPSAIIPLAGTPEWALTIDYAQDWATTNALAQYLLTNAGQQKAITFKPKKPTTTGPTFTITAVIQPGAIGGALDTVATASVTLQCVGQPVLATA